MSGATAAMASFIRTRASSSKPFSKSACANAPSQSSDSATVAAWSSCGSAADAVPSFKLSSTGDGSAELGRDTRLRGATRTAETMTIPDVGNLSFGAPHQQPNQGQD